MSIASSLFLRKSTSRLGLALALLVGVSACKGTRGILFDLWSWDEITQRSDSATIYLEEGALEIVAYPRKNVWIQRHVYCFEGSLGAAEYGVVDRVLDIVFDADGPATCFADHWLEIPEQYPVTMRVDLGLISILGASGPLTIDAGVVEVYGEELESPSVSLQVEDSALVALSFKTPPTLVTLSGQADKVELLLPPGHYRCGMLPAGVVIDPAIVCDPAATSAIESSITTPEFTIGPRLP